MKVVCTFWMSSDYREMY